MQLRILAASVVIMGLVPTEVQAQTDVRVPEELTLEAAKGLLISHSPTLQVESLNVDVETGDLINAEKRPRPTLFSHLQSGHRTGR
jgi:hypothetical protein